MSYPFIIQGNNVVVVIGNQSHTISKTHITYDRVIAAIKAGDWDTVKDVIEPKKVVLNYGKGNVTINGETLLWKGAVLNTGLATRMIQMLQEGFPIEPMVNFMENLMLNPSRRSVQELYGFLEKSNLPITPDGHFLAYKKVRDDYRDCYTGTMDNSVGKVVEMERNTVDDDKDRTCSAGLHFCSQSYLAHFCGARTVIVKINPRDVVSIPSDYNDAKGRACRYEVIGELNVDPGDAFVKAVQTTAVGSQPVVEKVVTKAPVATAPKVGNSPFYQGYNDGYKRLPNVARNILGSEAYSEGYTKGLNDHYNVKAPAYVLVNHSAAPAGPKVGSTDFYHGYTDGFTGVGRVGYHTKAFHEGYSKGHDDKLDGRAARYQYHGPQAPKGGWPFPV